MFNLVLTPKTYRCSRGSYYWIRQVSYSYFLAIAAELVQYFLPPYKMCANIETIIDFVTYFDNLT